MSKGEKKPLTCKDDSDIMPTTDEKRIIKNMRRYAKMYPHSQLAVLFQVHDGELKHGTLCLGSNTTIRI
ncbi:MAG: hypothetical protein HWN69_07055 [Desulfobacterales bacterium]|nr:hypothetical protein [Desulfobacterales bacterium]